MLMPLIPSVILRGCILGNTLDVHKSLHYHFAMRTKHRITMNVSEHVYLRCAELRTKYGVNWSQVAEAAFVSVIKQFDEIYPLIRDAKESGTSLASVQVLLREHAASAARLIDAEIDSIESK